MPEPKHLLAEKISWLKPEPQVRVLYWGFFQLINARASNLLYYWYTLLSLPLLEKVVFPREFSIEQVHTKHARYASWPQFRCSLAWSSNGSKGTYFHFGNAMKEELDAGPCSKWYSVGIPVQAHPSILLEFLQPSVKVLYQRWFQLHIAFQNVVTNIRRHSPMEPLLSELFSLTQMKIEQHYQAVEPL